MHGPADFCRPLGWRRPALPAACVLLCAALSGLARQRRARKLVPAGRGDETDAAALPPASPRVGFVSVALAAACAVWLGSGGRGVSRN